MYASILFERPTENCLFTLQHLLDCLCLCPWICSMFQKTSVILIKTFNDFALLEDRPFKSWQPFIFESFFFKQFLVLLSEMALVNNIFSPLQITGGTASLLLKNKQDCSILKCVIDLNEWVSYIVCRQTENKQNVFNISMMSFPHPVLHYSDHVIPDAHSDLSAHNKQG